VNIDKPTKVVSTKLTPDDRRLVAAAAAAEGSSVCAFVRAAVVPAAMESLRRRVATEVI
jgi:uncharacterized protein (DUF1778 family)